MAGVDVRDGAPPDLGGGLGFGPVLTPGWRSRHLRPRPRPGACSRSSRGTPAVWKLLRPFAMRSRAGLPAVNLANQDFRPKSLARHGLGNSSTVEQRTLTPLI